MIRPDPDAILKAIGQEEEKARSAKLRVFLGMSAGVGKTYSMLKAAHQRQKEGVDVLVGVVDTHGRNETAALLEGLTVLPRKQINYRGTTIEEMDLDAILAQKPQLIVVDELAHTNAPGSRHEKRYQDVQEILDAGIDVYTALNVQHLESRKDAVEAITGIPIRETVPDTILERASLVELVDIAPTELLKRLKEGKVYLGERAEKAAQNFFKEDRLTALREIALRMTAERVDQDLQRLSSVRSEAAPWQTNERLLVAVSHSPYSEKLIRATRRLAYNLEAPWIAVHIDNGIQLNDEDQAQLAKNLTLARELKAEVITTAETDVVQALQRISRQKNVTQVIVGRPTRRWIRDVIEGGSLLDRLVRESGDVDVHVIRQEKVLNYRPSFLSNLILIHGPAGLTQYWLSFCFILAVSLLSVMVEPFIGYRAVGFIFLLAVTIAGLFGSMGSVVFSCILSATIWDYFFIPPKLTFVISNADDIILCISLFVVALITGFLTHRTRFHEKMVREREERTNLLYKILQDIANSQEKSEFLNKVINRVASVLNARCAVILKSPQGVLDFESQRYSLERFSEKDQAVATWSFQNAKPAGWSTETLSQASALYIPLKGLSEVVGVFVFQPTNNSRKLSLEQENLLFSITQQLGISIERHFLTKRLAETQRLKDSEELHQTLLNSISHEMKTPLTTILGYSAALQDEKRINNPMYVRNAADELQSSGERLNRVIENLLDMSRLNSGVLSLKLEWHDFNDLLNSTIKKLEAILSKHRIHVQMPEELSLMKIDFRLMEHAISNILINAVTYTPENSEILVQLKKENNKFIFSVEDNGPGIAEDALPRIFDKFYRVPGSPTGGTGLGLSIVKSIIDLHKGHILVKNKKPHGLVFEIELPFEQHPEVPKEANE